MGVEVFDAVGDSNSPHKCGNKFLDGLDARVLTALEGRPRMALLHTH